MSRLDFLSKITEFLLTKCPRVYYAEAPEEAEFPYIIYDTPSSSDMSPGENLILEVDGWDDEQDTTELEILMESIDGNGKMFDENGNPICPTGLNRATFNVPGSFIATLYKDEGFNIPDPEKTLKRRQLRYECKIYYEN